MLRGAFGRQRVATSQRYHLVIFSVGGRRLAVKTEEVDGISPWDDSIPIPSCTPFVSAVIRRGQSVFPVFDLAGKLKVRVKGEHRLCLMAKQPDGALAICIDEDMPVLHSLEATKIQAYRNNDIDAAECFADEFEDVPILSAARLGIDYEQR
ncbi:MAG: CheW-like domain-containing protein [Nitrospira sp.]|nr:MAG: CheW-like domain-containing protein [Nitrospira sp.]